MVARLTWLALMNMSVLGDMATVVTFSVWPLK